MEINNELKRVRAKLNLLEDPEVPTKQVLSDLIDEIEPDASLMTKNLYVSLLKAKYNKFIRDNKSPNPSQGKLKIV